MKRGQANSEQHVLQKENIEIIQHADSCKLLFICDRDYWSKFFNLFLYFNHNKKSSKKGRDETQANGYGKQIASAMKALKKIQSYFNKISSLTSGHHYSFQYNIPTYCLAALFASP